MPYNKSQKRRAHPPYDQYREREYREREVEEPLDFDIQLPVVDWELPTLPDNTPQLIVPETTGIEVAPLEEQAEIIVEAPKAKRQTSPKTQLKPTQSRLQPKAKTKTQQRSQGGKEQSGTQEDYNQRRIQELQKRQQEQLNSGRTGKSNSVNPGAVIGPAIFFIFIMVIAISNDVPPFFLLLIAFFFGSQIWAAIKGNSSKK